MNYLRSLFLNFLVVFFVDRVSPGVEIMNFEQVPNIGADILFSALVGFFNASLFPLCAIMEWKATQLRLAVCTFAISFGAFCIIAFVPFGVRVVNFWGVLFGGSVVWGIAYLTNYLEWQHDIKGSP